MPKAQATKSNHEQMKSSFSCGTLPFLFNECREAACSTEVCELCVWEDHLDPQCFHMRMCSVYNGIHFKHRHKNEPLHVSQLPGLGQGHSIKSYFEDVSLKSHSSCLNEQTTRISQVCHARVLTLVCCCCCRCCCCHCWGCGKGGSFQAVAEGCG